jgi:hypothetical protein
MRNFILSFAMLVLPYLVFANDSGREDLSGNWYSKCISESIKIKERRDVLIVKGLGDCNNTQVFERINRKSYVDNDGNLLIADKCNVLVFIPNRGRHHREIVFEKRNNDHHDAWFNNDDDDHYDRNRGKKHGSWNEDRYSNDSYGQGQPYEGKWNNYEKSVTGTWDAGFRDKSIAIIDTRDGLKAKFSGTTKWVDYVQSRQNPYEFIDNKGNKYIFKGDGKASWISIDRSIKEIYLTKVSDDTRF